MNTISNVNGTSGVGFAVAYEMFPAVFLSEACSVVATTEAFRSCCGKTADRTLLLTLADSDTVSSLEAFCASPYTAKKYFPLNSHRFCGAVAYKLPAGTPASTVLILLSNELQKAFLDDLLSGRIPDYTFGFFKQMNFQGSTLLRRAVHTLASPMDELDGKETAEHLRRIVSRLCRNGEFISCNVDFSCPAYTGLSVTGVPSGLLSVGFASLLSILDCISTSGSIDVCVTLTNRSIEVRLSSMISESREVSLHTSEITDLYHLSPSCAAQLFLAKYSAVDSGMYMYGDHIGNGLSFTIGYTCDVPPLLEFKYRDVEKTMNDVISAVVTLLSALSSSTASVVQEEAE